MNLSKMTTRANTSIRNQTRRGQSLAGPQCLGVSFCVLSLLSAAGATHELSNASFQLILKQEGDAVEASLTLKPARLQVAAGPYLCQAELADAPPGPVLSGLSNTKISPGPRSLTIRGRLAGFSGYRYTNPQTQHELRRLVKEVVEPLGPTLMQVPDRKSDVAYLESFASQMFARRGTYGGVARS